MLPPILEIYVLWHPREAEGRQIAIDLFEHFHGTTFTGLIGGAVEVFTRSSNWEGGAPRPIPVPGDASVVRLASPHLIAVVPVIGLELAQVVEGGDVGWVNYLRRLVDANNENRERVGIFPVVLDAQAIEGTKLGHLIGRFQAIGRRVSDEDQAESRSRDLAQGVVQLAHPGTRLRVFISHTKRATPEEQEDVAQLVGLVRETIRETHLQDFFDASDLQPGQLWDEELRSNAAKSAMLAVRTDLYSSREWCQREIWIAKTNGMPVVTLEALVEGEARGSFLMDHVPKIPLREDGSTWRRSDIRRALNLLVDECLKSALWTVQRSISGERRELGVSWWAPHAPEPLTMVSWLRSAIDGGGFGLNSGPLRVLHPDPPLGPAEKDVLDELLRLCGHHSGVEIMTPRILAARGG